MGCFFSKPKTDIWNDDVQGFDNLAVDEKEVSGRTSQTFDFKKAGHRSRRRYSSEHSGIWMNLDKQIYLGRDSRGIQTVVNTKSQMVQTDTVWRMFDDKGVQTLNDVDENNSVDGHVKEKQEFDICEAVTCKIQSECGFPNGYECEISNSDIECEIKNSDNGCVMKNENVHRIKNDNEVDDENDLGINKGEEIGDNEENDEQSTLQLENEKSQHINVLSKINGHISKTSQKIEDCVFEDDEEDVFTMEKSHL